MFPSSALGVKKMWIALLRAVNVREDNEWCYLCANCSLRLTAFYYLCFLFIPMLVFWG